MFRYFMQFQNDGNCAPHDTKNLDCSHNTTLALWDLKLLTINVYIISGSEWFRRSQFDRQAIKTISTDHLKEDNKADACLSCIFLFLFYYLCHINICVGTQLSTAPPRSCTIAAASLRSMPSTLIKTISTDHLKEDKLAHASVPFCFWFYYLTQYQYLRWNTVVRHRHSTDHVLVAAASVRSVPSTLIKTISTDHLKGDKLMSPQLHFVFDFIIFFIIIFDICFGTHKYGTAPFIAAASVRS